MPAEDLDKVFCMMGKKYGIKKLLLKAVAKVESSLDPRAYRYEPAFWTRYLRDKPEWKDRDPAEVSSSYGLMQIMYTTAWALGFRGSGEDLYEPVYNVELGARLLKKLIEKASPPIGHLWPVEIALARYNGGSLGNPGSEGKLRNQKYVNRVLLTWAELVKKEKECDD